METVSRALLLGSTFLALTACGGGGGGSSSGTVTISSTPVAITPANAQTVTATTYDAAADLDDANTASGSLVGVVTTTNGSGAELTDLAQSWVARTGDLIAQNAGAFATGVVLSGSEPCTSGSFSFTLNDADNSNDLSTGDTINLTFNNCFEDGATLNGRMNLSNMAITGDVLSFPFTLQATFNFLNLRVTESGETGTLDGDMTISLASTDGINESSLISGNSITLTSGGVAERINNFAFALDENLGTGAYTLSVNATVDSNEQGGRTTLVTVTPFQGASFNADPFTGEGVISGDNSSVRLIVLDAVNVRLEVDQNGDNVTDSTIDTTWAALGS